VGLIIDTSIFIAAERRQLAFDVLRATLAQGHVAISVVTVSELLQGVHRATEKQRPATHALVEGLLTEFEVIPFDLPAARVHAALASELATKGTPVGNHDLLIAATAISRGLEVLTRDQRSFPRIPGRRLKVA
jgi:predicted nucleic acid-binding protein